jgi:hypothetical protein
VHDDVLGVREEERCLDLERELRGILVGADRALRLGVVHTAREAVEPVAQERDEPITDGSRVHVDLGQHRGEEAAAGEVVDLDVVQVAVGEDPQPLDGGAGLLGRRDDLLGEQLAAVSTIASCSSSFERKWA